MYSVERGHTTAPNTVFAPAFLQSQLSRSSLNMNLLTGYGSDSDEDSGHADNVQQRKPEVSQRFPLQCSCPTVLLHRTPMCCFPLQALQGRAAPAPGPSVRAAMRAQPGWSKLPPSETTGRKVIAFQLPLSRAALQEHSDEEDEEESAVRAAKRLKAAGARGAAKSKLMDFLPAPKNEDLSQALGAGAAGKGAGGMMGGRGGGGRPPKKGFFDDDDDDDEVDPVLAAGFGDGGAASVGLSNEAFRTAEGGAFGEDEDGGEAGPSSSSAGWAAGAAAWAQHPAAAYAQHHVVGSGGGGGGGPSRAAPPLGGGGFEMPAELAGVQFKEVRE